MSTDLVVIDGASAVLPVLTRDQVCAIRMSFQGLTVETAEYGSLGWFDAALFCLTSADRQRVYAAKRAAGDTHAIIEYDDAPESVYNESGQPYQQMQTAGFGSRPEAFRAAVVEVLTAGFVPCIFLNGDDGQRGYEIAKREIVDVVRVLGSLMKCVLVSPGYDGVFYGYTPEQIATFGAQFRQLCPDGYLAIEHQPGRIPIGNGPADWEGTGAMQAYDVLLSEFQDGWLHQDSTWQVAARTIGPLYRRPPEQPRSDDPGAPYDANHPEFYLRFGTPRGQFFSIAFEFGTYETVRNNYPPAQAATDRAYLRSLGYVHVC